MLRYSLVLFLYLAGTISAFRGFAFAICLYLWSNIFQPLEFARHGGALPVAWYVFIVLFAAYVTDWAKGMFRPKNNFFISAAGVFMAWLLVCVVVSPYPDGYSEYFTILKYFLPLVLISSGLDQEKDVKLVAALLMVSVGVWSAQGGVKGLVSGVTSTMSIPGGQMTDNNDFMAATVCILPVTVYFFFTYQGYLKVIVKSVLLAMLGLSISAIVFSNSRGAALGFIGMILYYIVFASTRKVRDFAIFTVLLVGLLLMLPDSFYERMSTIQLSTEQTEASAKERTMLMRAAWQCTLDHPVFGVGPNSWLKVSQKYAPTDSEPHSAFLKLSAETGFVGLALFLIIAIGTVVRLLRTRKRAVDEGNSDASRVMLALAMAIVGMLIPLTFLNHPYSEFLWAWVAISNSYIVVYKDLSQGDDKEYGCNLVEDGGDGHEAGNSPESLLHVSVPTST